MAFFPLNDDGFELVLAFTVQRGLSGDRSYSLPPTMISSNFRVSPAMLVCIVNFDASLGLITTVPSPVASKVTPPLDTCATSVKWASLTFAWFGLSRIACADGGPDVGPLQPASSVASA